MIDILQLIPVGKANAVTREELHRLTGFGDREIRKLIEAARDEGATIINDSDGKGYYFADEAAQIRRQIITNRNRAMSILRQQKGLKQRLRELEEQEDSTLNLFTDKSTDRCDHCDPDYCQCHGGNAGAGA